MGLLDNDYGAGAISAAVKGLMQGMQQGDEMSMRREERDENKRFREMELNSRMRAEDEKRAREAALDKYNKEKEKADRVTKLFSEGYDTKTLDEQGMPTAETKFRPDYVDAKRKSSGQQLIKDDPFSADLRSKWLSDPVTKDTRTISSSYSKILKAANNPSAAGDLSLIFSYMKILDPGSTVREGEFANAQNAAGVPDQVRNMYERVRSGERLNPAQRADFAGQAKNLYQAQMGQQEGLNKSFKGVASRRGLRGEDIVLSDMFDQGLLNEDHGLIKSGIMSDSPKEAGVGESIVGGVKSLLGSGKAAQPHPQDSDAVKWAKENKNDPRALKILKMNGL